MQVNARLVLLDQVLPGVVLGDNVHDGAGRVLLRVGSILSESTIEALRRRGIDAVPVEVPEMHSPEHLEIERRRLETHLQEAFRYAGDGVARHELWQALLEFKLGIES